ncbi:MULTISPECIES: AAA family ATPase [Clostridium]|uniref:AAA family ATPase n=1 Tax=Clostridium TaxID=1485 RepID=UPI000826FCB4|nr:MULTISPECIES: AAA family ATPase [Clostridium]PJI10049.1 hypothetical protein CUB90_20205 [Clostridium sp. CT7]
MELIYLYVEKFNGILKKQEINFSPNFDVKIENKRLIVNKKPSYMDKLYPKSMKNITMLLGKNGSGKTTLLDILGMNWDDRCRESIKRKGRTRSEVIDSYFILYHIQSNYFGIEIMDDMEPGDKITKLFKNSLTNFNFYKMRDPFYKIPMGLVIKKNNNNFDVIKHFFNKSQLFEDEISDQIKVNYISNKYSGRIDIRSMYIGKGEENYEDDDYLGKRRYYVYPSTEREYRYLNNINNTSELHFCGNSAIIHISPNIDYGLDIENRNKEMEKWIANLENILYIDKSERINFLHLVKKKQPNKKIELENNKKIFHKRIFILDVLSSYIIYQFIKGICDMIDNDREKNNNNGININFSNNKHIEFLNNLKKKEYVQSNSNFIFGKLSNKRNEYENLINVINYYKTDKTLEDYDKLICISRYLYSRMESKIGLGTNSKYQESIEEFLNSLNFLDEAYFNKNEILIDCKSKIDEVVVKVLRVYDFYFKSEYSDLNTRFNISISNLSEGEKNFLDLISKLFDIVIQAKENQLILILLDEPDQSLHPEWSRRFIKLLCDEIKKYENRNIQIVLSTHSPFMATDIMSDHIYCLENVKNEINICSMNNKKDEIYNTFGANIYEILKDSFILERTIGEFAYNKILDLIKELNNKKAGNSNMDYEKFLINSIGELPLRKKLQYMYIENRENQLKNNLLDLIKRETSEEKLNRIREILNGDKL